MDRIEILIKILPMVASILLGYFLTQKKVLNKGMVDSFKKIVVNVTLPAGLFIAFAKIDFQLKYLAIFLSLFISCFTLFYIGKLIAKIFSIKSKYFPFLMTGFESGMLGYAVFSAVFGLDSVADVGVVDIGQVSYVFLIFIPMLLNINRGNEDKANIKDSLKIALHSPVIWAIIIGLSCSMLNISKYENTLVFGALNGIFYFASTPTAFLIALVVGSGLKLSIKGLKMEITTAVLKVVLALTFAFIIANIVLIPLGIDKRIITALYAMSCMPAPFVIPVFMDDPDKNELAYVSNTLSIGSVIGVVFFTVLVLLGI